MRSKGQIWRPIATLTILVLTISGFVYYFITHPSVREQMRSISPATLLIITALYLFTVIVLGLITLATLRLCQVQMPFSEGILITAYAAIVNFFGPLQSGPAFRAVYLKKKYHLNLKNYAAATLVYYFFFGTFSGLFLISGILKWWLVMALGAAMAFVVAARYAPPLKARLQGLNLHNWYLLALATLLQVATMVFIYYLEVHSVAPATTLGQVIIYTGAANLALFVSLTPGAIGFRESFLLFSQRLHHISSSTIVAANIIDRATYIVLLFILGLFIFGTHAQRQLQKTAAVSGNPPNRT